MKSRIAIMVLAALLLVAIVVPQVAPPSAAAINGDYIYTWTVPFICGTAQSDEEGVKPGNYATTISIHNNDPFYATSFSWKVVRTYPGACQVSTWGPGSLGSDKGFTFRCQNICNRIGLAFPPPFYVTGFLVIQSSYDNLDVFAIYTTETAEGLSIDVEEIWASYYYVGPV